MAIRIETVTRYPEQSDYRTAGQMTDICCVSKPALPCREKLISRDWSGYSLDGFFERHGISVDAAGRDGQGRYLEVRDQARKNPCGEETNRYDITHRNCCDMVEPMAWDGDSSVEVLAPGTSGFVFVTGGAPPYHWSIRGEGMTLDGYNMRDGFTDYPYVRVYAGPFACGWAPIMVTDGCSIVASGVRSTEGKWGPTRYFNDLSGCEIRGISEESGNTWGVRQFTQISGKWKQTITAEKYWFSDGSPCLPDGFGPVCNGSLETYIDAALAPYCTGKVPSGNQAWCFDNMHGGAVAADPYGCCDPSFPRIPASISCARTIDAWVNEWVC